MPASNNNDASTDLPGPDREEVEDLSPQGRAAQEAERANAQRSGDAAQQDEARAGTGINQAGFLKDKDAPAQGKP